MRPNYNHQSHMSVVTQWVISLSLVCSMSEILVVVQSLHAAVPHMLPAGTANKLIISNRATDRKMPLDLASDEARVQGCQC